MGAGSWDGAGTALGECRRRQKWLNLRSVLKGELAGLLVDWPECEKWWQRRPPG